MLFILQISYLKNTLTVRTSFIGHNEFSKDGLLEWFLEQKGSCSGYTTALYSGLTTVELSNVFKNYILNNPSLNGIFNVSGSKRLTKYEFGLKIAKKFKFNKKFIKKLYLKETLKKVLRPKDMSLSNLKVKKILNKNTLFDLSNGISQLYKDYNSKYYNEIKKRK